MPKLDRYLLRQMLGPFFFFVLVFTGVIWLSQSLRVIDTIVNNGQSAWVFLEFTALLLPRVLSVVIPIAAFAATLYTINRLYSDSEIVVMFAAGQSGTSLFRPVAIFCLALTLVVYAVTLYAMPTAQRAMRDRINEIRGDVAAAFLREGTFLSPSRNVTVYIRETARPGELLGIFVHDARDPAQVATYTAERALLLSDEQGTRLVMIDGVAQIKRPDTPENISLLKFDQVAYDLTQFTENGRSPERKPSELYIWRLLTITDAETGRRSLGQFRAEGHEALSGPLYVLALPMLAVAFVISAGFRRQGFLVRILLAVAAALALRFLGLAAKGMISSQAFLWPTLYLPPLAGIALAYWAMTGKALGLRHARKAPTRALTEGGR